MTERRRRRGEQLLDDLTGKTGHWKLKEEALDRTVCRTGSERGCGPVVMLTAGLWAGRNADCGAVGRS